MPAQLALNLRLRDASSFENFYVGANREAVECLRRLVEQPDAGPASLMFWGEPGSGRSHLLEAACRAAHRHGAAPLLVPLADPAVAPAMLEEAEHASLICLDDVDCVAGNPAWESALFTLYELGRAGGARLVASANAPPAAAGFRMPELATRLGWGPVYQLRTLADAEKGEAIRLRASNRGIELAPEVMGYILNRYPRDLASLFALLDRIDAAALAHQRRVTIPFLRRLEAEPRGT